MNYRLIVDVAPVSEPVTVEEAKTQLRIESGVTIDDAYIGTLISAARDRVESYCGRYFTSQTATILFDGGFTDGTVQLPLPDLSSIESITYLDSDHSLQSMDASEYSFDSVSQGIYSSSWPSDAVDMRIQTITSPPVVIDGVKQAILMIVTDLYELRTEVVIGQSVALNPAVKSLLYPYRMGLGI